MAKTKKTTKKVDEEKVVQEEVVVDKVFHDEPDERPDDELANLREELEDAKRTIEVLRGENTELRNTVKELDDMLDDLHTAYAAMDKAYKILKEACDTFLALPWWKRIFFKPKV